MVAVELTKSISNQIANSILYHRNLAWFMKHQQTNMRQKLPS